MAVDDFENAIDNKNNNDNNKNNNKKEEKTSETRDNALIRKYKEMADFRRDYEDVDIRDCIPTLDEMVKDDLMYDILEKAVNGETEKDVTDAAFYTDGPPTHTLGYHSDKNVFILKIPSIDISQRALELNEIDGDTFRVPINSIVEGKDGFTMNNGEEYDSFKDYCIKKNLIDPDANSDNQKLQVRLIGINCPEIPHYSIQPMKDSDIVSMTIKEAKKKGAKMEKYKYNGTSALDRPESDDTKIDFYRIKKSNGQYGYHEIIKDAGNLINSSDKVSGYKYKKIVVSDDSTKDSLVGGYKARDNLVEMLRKGNVYVMLDANGIKANKTSSKYKLYYNHWWNAADTIGDMIDQWQNHSPETALTKLSYSPYGTDGYGRFIGSAYVYQNDLPINIAKYNIADQDTKSVSNPDFSSSPELGNLGGDNAAAFELYSYDINKQIWLDSFTEMTKDSYNQRIAFHKEVAGLDFTKLRNCTMMIGDTLLLIPPQNIRSMSNIEYEKVSIMRGKGSMIKNNTNRDMYLEVDLFFYNNSGINGIAKEIKLPNGEERTYYLNGLRSLIAQFKVAPYLPVENQFINDVLGIEAVSLVNLSVSTVEGMPRLLQATLTMRDFNYRVYMPDVPIDYSSNQVAAIAEMNPIFAKCFNWEVFRYYYQRMLSFGNLQKEFQYGTLAYNKELYSKKEVLQPVYFCEKDGFGASDISFYIPDENWLKAALSIKKDKEFYGQDIATYDTTEECKAWINEFCTSAKAINTINSSNVTSALDKMLLDNTLRLNLYQGYKISNVLQSQKTNLLSDNKKEVFKQYIKPVLKPIEETCLSSSVISNVNVNEITDIDNLTLSYEFILSLNTSNISVYDMEAIKESIRDTLDMKNIAGIFKDNKAVFNVQFKIQKDGGLYKLNTKQRPTITGRTFSIEEDVELTDLDILSAFANGTINGESMNGNKQTNETLDAEYDYLNPAAMQFVSYIENIEVHNLSFSLTNNFADITLKVLDGFAPQYMGSSDTVIELSFITNDPYEVSMLNVLPAHAANISKLYRRILSCWPIRVRNQYLQLAGINEVLIDLIEVQTVQGFPGAYEVRMRMTSVDRTMRMRETMKQLESDKKSGSVEIAAIRSYWDVENVLSNAELYPDLDLPSIKELAELGFNFIRYRDSKQAYPDPDFYLSYSWPYTAAIIKKNLKDIFYNQIFHDEGKDKSELLDDTNFKFFDQMGMELYRKLDPFEGLTEAKNSEGKVQNKWADEYDKAIEVIDSSSEETIKRKKQKSEEEEIAEKNCADLSDILIFLTACDMQDGWILKPGYTAPVVKASTNTAVEQLDCSGIAGETAEEEVKNAAFAQDIFDLRAEAIKAIDSYLSDPIDYNRYDLSSYTNLAIDNTDYEPGLGPLLNKVAGLFASEPKGKKILQLLNPFETEWKTIRKDTAARDRNDTLQADNPIDYTKPYTIDFLGGFLYSAAKCISASNTYDASKSANNWEPTQYRTNEHGAAILDDTGNYIPYCTIERNGKKTAQADSLQEAIDYGIQWGMFQIKKYRASELRRLLQPSSRVTYLPEKDLPLYKDPKTGKERWHAGFIDPYYNIAGYKSKIGKEYIEKISTNEGANAIAFLRNVLVYLRKMIIDGLIFSEIDIIAKDFDSISKTVLDNHITVTDNFKASLGKLGEVALDIVTLPVDLLTGILGGPSKLGEVGYDLFIDNTIEYADDVNTNARIDSVAEALDGDEKAAETIVGLVESIPDTYRCSFCARLILPIIMAATQNDESLNTMLELSQLTSLNNLTAGFITNNEPMTPITKFCNAMFSIGMMEYSRQKTDPETTSDSQKLWNYIMKEAYTKLANDPQAYILHSYYDMLINDKRGRLLRAFPTYYIIFMDEGRKIGSWKLFDNFYNMSAVSEITVSKSRKIPADTCSFVMSNMYTSYAAEYDNTTKQQYVDVYGLRDVFDSIFSPRSYFLKEDSLRRRKDNLETVVLKPGVRIHVRMGYGADASRLPVVFNGKIAEIDVGDVVQVIAQGDGIELSNQLNTLGEIDAVSLTESTSWCTMFKDLRGSMRRGGESPRNLLSKLLTAQYGGAVKTFFREVSDGRFYSDNPFGIYHFGDKRFNDIFREGECVQNLYEVCDATLLKGVNELYVSEENVSASPTINTSLQDKTFWDILQLCACSGVNYIGAIRDFGFRSTVCLCKPNHYYAYGYKVIDDDDGGTAGKIVERRKPFQQYHYYDSYTDIVYNSIKASEKNMKTNATGLWESTDMIWGRSQSTVGPIYLDINIYPEYQKSMTVDTTLVSDGEGGIELNLFTHFSEKWAADEYDTKVNKALAERVTTNVLRESVSNMYCGEVCVLGDMSIKPHDRFYINDYYEDMQGHMEVEAVVYSMNSATGFTTTIYPDLIVRSEDVHEAANILTAGSFIGSLITGIGGRLMLINTFARVDSKLLTAIVTKVAGFSASTPVDDVLAAWAATSLGKALHISKAKSLLEAAKLALSASVSVSSIVATAAIATGVFIIAQNTKSWATSFLRNIQALTVYPITKNQRPLIAGMAGHRGSVYGYTYTEEDAEDSLQGLIYKSVEWLNDTMPFNMGDLLMNSFTRKTTDNEGNKISEYERLKERWSQTLPLEEEEPLQYFTPGDSKGLTDDEIAENLYRTLYNGANKEMSCRNANLQGLKIKYRIPSLLVSKDDKLADEVYKRYNILDVKSFNDLATNKKVLGLYPIEDEIDIKRAVVEKSHPVIKQLTIAHSTGDAKVQIPFESGNRIIKLFTERSSEDGTIYDLPMLQEDAVYILKLILNDQALKNKEVEFLSGTRINDKKTWKNTGFAFILDSNDRKALLNAIENIRKQTSWLNGNKDQAIFEYKEQDKGVLIIVYAPRDAYNE